MTGYYSKFCKCIAGLAATPDRSTTAHRNCLLPWYVKHNQSYAHSRSRHVKTDVHSRVLLRTYVQAARKTNVHSRILLFAFLQAARKTYVHSRILLCTYAQAARKANVHSRILLCTNYLSARYIAAFPYVHSRSSGRWAKPQVQGHD